jgi:uncharacterized protein YcnI
MRNEILFGALLLAPIPALAHVTLGVTEAKPGAHFTAEFRVGHGCDGSPTTMLTVAIPDGVGGIVPRPKPGWLAELSHDGGRISAVTWKGGVIAADKPDSFALDMVLPSRTGPLVFTANQTCQTGSESWSELPAADGHKLKRPAPVLTVTSTPAPPKAASGTGMPGMTMPDGSHM